MKIYYKKKITLLFFLGIYIFCLNNLAHAFIYNLCSQKKSGCKVELDSTIKQLSQFCEAHSQCLIKLQQQFSENQQDIDILRGNIQDIQHNISRILDDQKEIYKKLDIVLDKNKQLFKKDREKSSISEDDLKVHIYNNDNNLKFNNHEEIDYKTAVELVLEKKQYIYAIKKFQDFIEVYPKSHYQPNAHYWLGQLYYNQGKKNDSAYHFAWVVKNYPKSSKAPDSLLKIATIMQENDQKDKAQTIYRQIIKLYPNSDSAKQAQKRLMH